MTEILGYVRAGDYAKGFDNEFKGHSATYELLSLGACVVTEILDIDTDEVTVKMKPKKGPSLSYVLHPYSQLLLQKN